MINDRLKWYLNKFLTNIQCGFYSHRSPLDHLSRLDTYVRNALNRREHVVSVFFDLEKAYETMWRYGVLSDIHGFGMQGRLTLSRERVWPLAMRAQMGKVPSESFPQAKGVPQSSVLSVTMFASEINGLASCLNPTTKGSLFVDDFWISFGFEYMPTIETHLQECFHNLKSWVDENGFEFLTNETAFLLTAWHHDPPLTLFVQPYSRCTD